MFNSNASSASSDANYVEDVFSTYLYTGTGAAQTLTNGIDLSTKGGLVWCKDRNSGVMGHHLVDTVRGASKDLQTQSTNGETTVSTVTAFTNSGFTLGTSTDVNNSGTLYTSWSFREQEKFFDVVTYTGNGASSNSISHNLKSVPGFIIAKKTNGSGDWIVCNRYSDSLWFGGNAALNWGLNSTAAAGAGVDPTTRGITSTAVDVAKLYGSSGSFDATKANASGATYVMYVFAHDAGGFGLTGTDSVTYCGGVSVSGGAGSVTLGWEPQWVLLKNADTTAAWYLNDNMRGMTVKDSTNSTLYPNDASVESTGTAGAHPTATGFTVQGVADGTYTFLAIRRGPMKVPTDGTSVFNPSVRASGTGAAVSTTGVGFPPDLLISTERTTGVLFAKGWHDRLRGNVILISNSANNEAADSTGVTAYGQDGFSFGADGGFATVNYSGSNYVYEALRRAPSFFDEVCYTGTGSAMTVAHNLAAVPQLIIVKARVNARNWTVYSSATGNTGHLILNNTSAYEANSADWDNTSPTSSVFTVGGNYTVNDLNAGMVAYLFATCAGVSKVGSYTGTATTQQINCGFTAGARFVMIKRTDSTGDWYVWDSARGIVSGNDPYFLLNTNAAEVTSTDYVDTYAAGFELSSTAPAAINASGGTYIFLAIA